jgi:predicted alpha/beta-hydrolase family hydrolase
MLLLLAVLQGGRVAVAVAADAEGAEGYTVLGCVLSSYPLHPPAKPVRPSSRVQQTQHTYWSRCVLPCICI